MRSTRVLVAWETVWQQDGGAAGGSAACVVSYRKAPDLSARGVPLTQAGALTARASRTCEPHIPAPPVDSPRLGADSGCRLPRLRAEAGGWRRSFQGGSGARSRVVSASSWDLGNEGVQPAGPCPRWRALGPVGRPVWLSKLQSEEANL